MREEFRRIPERYWLILYVMMVSQRIVTSIKLQKLVFLVQLEGKIKQWYRFVKFPYGPYSKELESDVLLLYRPLGLVRIEKKTSGETGYPYYIYEITPKGLSAAEQMVSRVRPRALPRVKSVVEKYEDWNYDDLLNYIYERYVIKPEKLSPLLKQMKDEMSILGDAWREIYRETRSISASRILGVLGYLERVSSVLEGVDDEVVRSVCLCQCYEFVKRLAESHPLVEHDRERLALYEPSAEMLELFDYLQHYCERNNIYPTLLNIDYADYLSEEDLKRLEESFKTIGQ